MRTESGAVRNRAGKGFCEPLWKAIPSHQANLDRCTDRGLIKVTQKTRFVRRKEDGCSPRIEGREIHAKLALLSSYFVLFSMEALAHKPLVLVVADNSQIRT